MPKHVKEPTAVGNEDGSITVILPEDYYEDGHPLVKAHPDKFFDVLDGVTIIPAPAPPKKAAKAEEPAEA